MSRFLNCFRNSSSGKIRALVKGPPVTLNSFRATIRTAQVLFDIDIDIARHEIVFTFA